MIKIYLNDTSQIQLLCMFFNVCLATKIVLFKSHIFNFLVSENSICFCCVCLYRNLWVFFYFWRVNSKSIFVSKSKSYQILRRSLFLFNLIFQSYFLCMCIYIWNYFFLWKRNNIPEYIFILSDVMRFYLFDERTKYYLISVWISWEAYHSKSWQHFFDLVVNLFKIRMAFIVFLKVNR